MLEEIEDSRPELDAFQNEMYYHWTELDSCRHFSDIERKIPWTAIREYAYSFVEIDNLDDFEYFLCIIRSIDNFYLNWMNEKRTEELEKQKSKMERESRVKRGPHRGM